MTLLTAHRRTLAVASTLAAAALLMAGCSQKSTSVLEPGGPGIASIKNGGELSMSNPAVRAVSLIQERHTQELMAMQGVVGTATTVDENGNPAVMVMTETQLGAGRLPATLDGVPVVEEVTGKIRAMAVADHRVLQAPPIQMGTSGGWRYDLANGFCCGGTLGSCVKKGTTQYVLSNYHVLEADIVSGGNNRVAQAGDPVVQPGLIDVNCTAANAQNVASLSGIKSLPNSNVDCAIASVISGQVRTDGSILEVGTISASTVGASVGQAVKKSGRTTGLSRSSVSGLNATVSVQYENECAGGNSFVKTFTGQIVVRNRGSKFLNSGDSGSLMVEDVSTNPRAVGLLFAGSSTSAIANPIGQVLSFLGATMVGN